MILLISITLLMVLAIFLYTLQPKYGKAPSGEQLALIQASPNLKNSKFQIIGFTSIKTEGYSMIEVV
ncbi:hypothetical protein [Arthrospiribacter ruber]|uniref:Uncharacterized protein n=1 Tax=Arthrospiribacter ruber TaxID=2487934 RepID=A0A951J0J4_9BACT|nr:hypothetical protein [Arthrospiribacter ruber]MBW3470458.1 hypothetical protein [Arthrospiribacter ruber]